MRLSCEQSASALDWHGANGGENLKLQIEDGSWETPKDDLEALVQLQNVLLAAVEGARDGEIDLEYQALRRAILAIPAYRKLTPSFIRANRDLVSLWPFFKNFDGSWAPRRKMVREEMSPMMDEAERQSFLEESGREKDSSDWTGVQSGKQRLAAIKSLVPVAQASIETLIATLEAPKHNGGPPLDDHEIAIENLRELHKKLGELLAIEDEAHLTGSLGTGLLAEIAAYGKRAARALRNDPVPYAFSGLLLSILTVCGAPGIAAYMAGVAMNIRKTASN